MKPRIRSLISVLACGAVASSGLAQTEKVDFVRDIAPIFVTHCIECHSIDEPEADLRLDIKSGLFGADKEDWTVIQALRRRASCTSDSSCPPTTTSSCRPKATP